MEEFSSQILPYFLVRIQVKDWCENGFGYTFTQGQNEKYLDRFYRYLGKCYIITTKH